MANKLSVPSRTELQQVLGENPSITHAGIAKLYGVARTTARLWLIERGLSTIHKGGRALDLAEVHAAYRAGYTTPKALAKFFGCGWHTARRAMDACELSRKRRKIRIRAAEEPELGVRCRMCNDPIDSNDPIWGGEDGVHTSCLLMERRAGIILFRG
jgi:hypothetical protein